MPDLFDLPFEEEDSRQSSVDSQQSSVDSRQAAAPSRRVFTVTELTLGVRDLLEERFSEIWVEGELSNCKTWNTGHLFFTLKDDRTQIKGVIFRSALRYLKFKPADGLRVVARGRVSVYELSQVAPSDVRTLRRRSWLPQATAAASAVSDGSSA